MKLAPGAKMVEAIPPMAQILAADSRRLYGQQISAFYCGNDAAAKASVASLLRDLDLDPIDAGPLTSARYVEPAGMLCVQLAYGMGIGPKARDEAAQGIVATPNSPVFDRDYSNDHIGHFGPSRDQA